MRQTGKIELGIGMEFLLDKAAEEGRRRRAVETMVVIKDSEAHLAKLTQENLLVSLKPDLTCKWYPKTRPKAKLQHPTRPR